MIKFQIKSHDELIQAAEELLHITVNLKYYTDLWYNQGGYNNKEKRKYWEEKRDAIIERLTKKESE